MSEDEDPATDRQLWAGACSHWHYAGHWLLGLILAGSSATALYYYSAEVQPWLPWAYVTPVVLLILVASVIAWKRAGRRYQITSSRVVVQIGRIVRDSNEIRVQDIRSINVTKRGLGGFFGIGTVEFASAAADDAEVIFVGISGADDVRDIVRKLQKVEAV